jgi:hypothetical protein
LCALLVPGAAVSAATPPAPRDDAQQEERAPWRLDAPAAFSGAASLARADRAGEGFDPVRRPSAVRCTGLRSPTSRERLASPSAEPGAAPVCGGAFARWVLAHATATAAP